MQLTLNFEEGITSYYASCKEFIAFRVHQLNKPMKATAADMDLSPSDLARKLGTNPDDPRRFTLDDLEKYLNVTGDLQPVYYLIEKYLAAGGDEIETLKRRIAQLEANKLASEPQQRARVVR